MKIWTDALTDADGIARAVATSYLSEPPNDPLENQVRNNHYGDIYIIQAP